MSGVQSSTGDGLLAQLEHAVMGKLKEDFKSLEQDFSKLLGGDSSPSNHQASNASPSSSDATSAPLSSPDATGSPATSAPSATSSPFDQAGSGGPLGDVQKDFGLLSTIEDAGKKLLGDKNPQSNEADRLGQEAGVVGKIENLIKNEMGLMSHADTPSSTASDPFLVNKTQVSA